MKIKLQIKVGVEVCGQGIKGLTNTINLSYHIEKVDLGMSYRIKLISYLLKNNHSNSYVTFLFLSLPWICMPFQYLLLRSILPIACLVLKSL